MVIKVVSSLASAAHTYGTMHLQGKNFSQVGQEVLQRFHSWVTAGKGGEEWALEAENHEGWRVSVDEGNGQQGWLLLRASLHDPLLVLNAESELVGGAALLSSCRSHRVYLTLAP